MRGVYVLLCCAFACMAAVAADYRSVEPGHLIAFPQDEGSHPQFRTEWWYVTGWLESSTGRPFGFQVTFFRHRPGFDEHNPSRFAARQLLFAHASLSDPRVGKLLRAEKMARAGFGLAEANEGSLDVRIDDWRLRRETEEALVARVAAERFRFELEFRSSQPPLLHGRDGYSQKTPDPAAASYYYSLPQLQVRGRIRVDGEERAVRGIAWLDHEWFTDILDRSTQGWDWTGLNLEDGSALMALRMRTEQGETYWAAATWCDAKGATRAFEPGDVRWEVRRRWRSPRTGIEYPVEVLLHVGARTLHLRPLMEDQENDARASVGIIYWEGAMRAYDESGRYVGRGYLELTGYGERIRF